MIDKVIEDIAVNEKQPDGLEFGDRNGVVDATILDFDGEENEEGDFDDNRSDDGFSEDDGNEDMADDHTMVSVEEGDSGDDLSSADKEEDKFFDTTETQQEHFNSEEELDLSDKEDKTPGVKPEATNETVRPVHQYPTRYSQLHFKQSTNSATSKQRCHRSNMV